MLPRRKEHRQRKPRRVRSAGEHRAARTGPSWSTVALAADPGRAGDAVRFERQLWRGDVRHERRGRAPRREHGARELHGRAGAAELVELLVQ